MKRTTHICLALLLALVLFASQPTEALAESELYPYQIFEAEYYADNFESTFDLESGSYARNFYEALSKDTSFMATITAWESIHIATDLSYSLESGMITLRDFYRTVLFDLLCVQTTMDGTSTYVDELYNNVNSDYNKLLVDCTKTLLGKEDLSLLDLKTTKITEEQKAILTEETGLGNAAETAEIASMILRGAKSVYDGIDLMAKYCAVRDLNDGTREILEYIGNDSSNEYELRMAALDLVECFQGGYDQVVQAMVNGGGVAVGGIVGTVVDKAWDTLMTKTPGAAMVFTAAKGVRCLVNLFGNADAKVQSFYQIKASVLCEDALFRAMTSKKNAVGLGTTPEDAKIYMRAVRMYQSTVLLGFDYSVNMLQTIEDSFQGIILGNSDNAAALISQIQSLKSSKNSNYQRFDDLAGENYRAIYGTEFDEILDVLEEPYLMRFDYDVTTQDGELVAIITRYWGDDTDVRIPGLVDGLPVVGLGEYTFSSVNVYVTSVVVPGCIEVIERQAFYHCTSLKEVYIANGVTAINGYAFSDCTNLETVTLPDSLTFIGYEAFSGCSKLSSVTIPDSVTTIGAYAFKECSKLSSVTLPSGLTILENGVFSDCTSLTGVTIPESVTVMGSAFYNCSSLKEITIPSGVTQIAMSTFRYCSSLTEITIPDGVYYIGGCAFEGCTGLTEIIIPDAVSTIGHSAFQGCTGLTEIIIPDAVSSIGDSAFQGCTGLTAISIPERVSNLGSYTFSDCTALASVKLPSCLNTVSKYLFKGCTSLKSITFPAMYYIEEYAFFGCTALESVYFPYSLPDVHPYAFGGCAALRDVYYGGTQSLWTSNLYFIEEGNDPLTAATLHCYWSADCSHAFEIVTVEPTCTESGSVTRTCTACGASYVETIGALGHSSVDGVCTVCGESSYYYGGPCGDNLSWYYENTGEHDGIYTMTLIISGTGSMDDYEPWMAPWIDYTYSVNKVVFQEGVTHIGDNTLFNFYHVTEIEVPVSLISFGSSVFEGCEALTEIYYAGTEAQWQKISFGEGNESVLSNVTVHYTEAAAPTIQPLGAGLAFKDEIQYNAYFTVSNPSDVEISEMGLLTWTSAIDGTVETAEHVLTGAVEEDGMLKVRSQPIAAKNMGDTIYMKVYLKLADGSYVYSDLLDYSAKVYAANMLADASADAGVKSLCVALLNYGTAAQEYFGYKTDDLMNADLSAEQQALVEPYADTMIPALVGAGEKAKGLAATGGFADLAASVNFGGALGINYIFKPNQTMDGELKLYVWTASDLEGIDAMTLENASQVLTMTANGTKYTARVSGIAARNAGNTVYVCGVYESEGVEYRTGVLAYSVTAYCRSYATKDHDFQPMAATAAVYTYYAGAYLGS